MSETPEASAVETAATWPNARARDGELYSVTDGNHGEPQQMVAMTLPTWQQISLAHEQLKNRCATLGAELRALKSGREAPRIVLPS